MIAPRPSVRLSSGRSGATSGTRLTSTGDPTTVSEAIGRSRRSAAVSRLKIPPRLQPTTCTGRPPACCETSAMAARAATSSTQCSMPRLRLRNDTSPYSTRYVGRPAVDEVLDQRAAAAQVEADRRRGQRRHHQHRVALLADPGRPAGSGRPRAARPRRSGSAASAAGRPARRRAPCAPRCWPPTTTWSGLGIRSMARERTVARGRPGGRRHPGLDTPGACTTHEP